MIPRTARRGGSHCQATGADGLSLLAQRRDPRCLDARGDRCQLHVVPDACALGPRSERSPRVEWLFAKEGVRHGGWPRRSRPIGVDLLDRSPPLQNVGREHSGRRLGRPGRGREDRWPHTLAIASSWASTRERLPGTATRATVVPTRRVSRGERPRRRWPRKSIPSSSSSGCSAPAGSIQKSGPAATICARASSILCGTIPRAAKAVGDERPPQNGRILQRDSRAGSAD